MLKKSYVNPTLALLTVLLSSIAWLYNAFMTQYPGNNYFPEHTPTIFLSLGFIYAGLALLFGSNNQATRSARELITLLLVMSVIAFASNAVQYTPFPPIDKQIIAFEEHLHMSMTSIVQWGYSYSWFRILLEFCYATLPYQMSFLPLVVIFSKRYDLLREYYFLMLSSTLIGFSCYYFFPTIGPASAIQSPLFTDDQFATGLKFFQIHQHIPPTTMEGGMIALPSFHAIWAWLCLYLIRPWKIAFTLLAIINVLLVLSCVVLGWHYPIDLVASFIMMLFLHRFWQKLTSVD